MDYYKLPRGVQDLLPDECYNLNVLKDRLGKLFEQSGYRFVSSAILDYYDTYSEIVCRIPQDRMFKLTDSDGKLLVLRPDMTLSVERMAAKLSSEPQKLCYFSNIWNFREQGGISSREVLQAGVEMLGVSGIFSDAQTVSLAVESLLMLGVKDFIVDIGHVGFFRGLLAASGLDSQKAELVRGYVNTKDIINAGRILREYGVDDRITKAILALPTLFGGEEVFARARALTDVEEALASVDSLERLYSMLKEFGYEKYITIDFGTVKSLSYYSGIVFTGLTKSIGVPVLSGGRYDNLANDFGRDCPAVGFAIGLKRVLVVLERQGDLTKAPDPEIIILSDSGYETLGYNAYQNFLKKGKTVELFAGTVEDGKRYAGKKTSAVYLAGKEGVVKLW